MCQTEQIAGDSLTRKLPSMFPGSKIQREASMIGSTRALFLGTRVDVICRGSYSPSTRSEGPLYNLQEMANRLPGLEGQDLIPWM
jgi:hypothetical protein